MPRQTALSFKDGIQQRLAEYRDRTGMSQTQFAERLGIQKDRYAKWETRSTIPAEFIPAACELLGVTAWFLLTGSLVEEHMRRTEGVAARRHPTGPRARTPRQTLKTSRATSHG